jgi:hypothetical protein
MTEAFLATALAFAKHGHAVLPLTWPVRKDGKTLGLYLRDEQRGCVNTWVQVAGRTGFDTSQPAAR